MLWLRNVVIGLAGGAMLALTACGGSSKPTTTTTAESGAAIAPSGPKADALLVIADPDATNAALTEALSQASVNKYFLTSLSMDSSSFDGLHFAGDTVWGTELTAPSADAAAFNTAYLNAYGHPASEVPGTAAAYDAVYVVALAAMAANSADPAVIRDNLTFVANSPGDIAKYGKSAFTAAAGLLGQGRDVNYVGASGQVDLDANGEIAKTSVETWRVLNGTIAPIETRDIDLAAEAGATIPPGNPPARAASPSATLAIGMIVSADDAGTAFSNAAKLAIVEINAAGGVWGHDVALQVGTIGGAGQAATAAGKLITDSKVAAIIGLQTADAVNEALAPAASANVALLTLSEDPALTGFADTNNVLFRLVPSQALQMPVLANLFLESYTTSTGSPAASAAPPGSVCVVYQAGAGDEQMAIAFANAMTFKKATVRASIPFDPASADYKSLLQSCIGS
jgi:ABC-type branched-subunit amino acid transport system substrate-binding protein